MKMYNFDFVDKAAIRLETRNYMMRSLREAQNRCESLYETYGEKIGAARVCVRENGGIKVLYEWPKV
jgi:hypothetical protein